MTVTLLEGDSLSLLAGLPAKSVQCCVTSPPYFGLRDYGTAKWVGGDSECPHTYQKGGIDPVKSKKQITSAGTIFSQYEHECKTCGAKRIDEQIGLESTPELYVEKLVQVFREVRRVLYDDGLLWLNLGDSYANNKTGEPGQTDDKMGWKHNGKTLSKGHQGRATSVKGIKAKDLIGIPWMVAFALRADGWYLRSEIIWAKPSCMPESVKDRPTKSHEQIFLLAKSAKYYYDYEAILEPAAFDGRKQTVMKGSAKYQNGFAPTDPKPNTLAVVGHERWPNKMKDTNLGGDGTGFHGHSGNNDANGDPLGHVKDGQPARNKRDVWTVNTKPYKHAHFATFPPALIEPCILAGSRVGDTVIDPFNGSGTTGEVSIKHHRSYIGLEINPDYIKLTRERLALVQPVLI